MLPAAAPDPANLPPTFLPLDATSQHGDTAPTQGTETKHSDSQSLKHSVIPGAECLPVP